MKKTIIYVGGFELPDKNAAAHRVINNAKALKELGFNVVFIDIDRETNESVLHTENEILGFKRYSMQYTNKRLVSIKDFQTVFSLYGNQVCAVIAYNYPGIALEKMRFFCKRRDIKLIADCTEWYGAQGDNLVRRIIKGADSYIRMNIVQPKLDGMIAISRYLESFYKKKLPTIYVPPLADITEAKWGCEDIQPHRSVRIVYAGSPGKNKDKINLIIGALSKIDAEFEFTVIGISATQYLEYYPQDKEVIQQLEGRLFFKGHITHEQVVQYIRQADVSMFYRNKTRVTMAGFPTKFSESISCGTPVITNRTSDLEEYLVEGVNGYWIGEDIEESLTKIFERKDAVFSMKGHMDPTVFDYHKFIETLQSILVATSLYQ